MTEENEEPVIKCVYCDRQTDVPGHQVVDGRIRACPNIGYVVTIDGQQR